MRILRYTILPVVVAITAGVTWHVAKRPAQLTDSSAVLQVVPATTPVVEDVRLCASWTAEPTTDATAEPNMAVLRRLPAIDELSELEAADGASAGSVSPMEFANLAPAHQPAVSPAMEDSGPMVAESDRVATPVETVGPELADLTFPDTNIAATELPELELPELTLPAVPVVKPNLEQSKQTPVSRLKIANSRRKAAERQKRLAASASPEPQLTPEQLLPIQLPNEVIVRTRSMLRDATSLANRGAHFAAREQFEKIMRITCQALDAQVGRPVHSRALARGLRAIEEAEDFSLHGDSAESDLQLGGFIEGHTTPVLKDVNPGQITSLLAMQAYYRYAVGELAIAGNNEPISSEALFSLGRIEALLSCKTGEIAGGGPKSLAYYHAALAVNASNGRAANELGVMLARRGRLQDARNVLHYAAATEPTAVANLAKVYGQLGDRGRAMQLTNRVRQIAAANPSAFQSGPAKGVRWVDPATFANAEGATEGPPAASPIRRATNEMRTDGRSAVAKAAVFQQNKKQTPTNAAAPKRTARTPRTPFGWGR